MGRHHDEHQDDDQYHQNAQVEEGVLHILVRSCQLPADLRRNLHLAQLAAGTLHQVAQHGVGSGDRLDGDNALAVFTLDGGRCHALDHLAYVAQTDALALVVVDQDILDVFDRLPELGRITHLDVVFLAILAIFRGGRSVDTVAQVERNACHVQPMDRQFLSVEINLILGDVVASADVHLRTALHRAHALCHLGGHSVGLLEVVAVDLDIHRGVAAHRALFASGQYGELLDLAVLRQVLTHHFADRCQSSFAFAHADQTDNELDDVRAVVAHLRIGVVGVGNTLCEVADCYLGILLAELLVDSHRQLAADLLSGADGQLHRDAHTGVILCGEEFRLDHRDQAHAGRENAEGRENDGLAMANRPVQEAGVAMIQFV